MRFLKLALPAILLLLVFAGPASAGPPAGYTFCSQENQTCSFSGKTQDVIYGANNNWTAPRTFTNSVACNNSTFGDPLVGTFKACYTRDTSAPQGETLLSQGKTATASSVETPASSSCTNQGGCTAAKAVDGNSSTRWASNASDPQWLEVDLGQTYGITHVKLNWETAYGKAYKIQVSNDGTTWTDAYSTTTGDGGTDDLTGLTATGRYVRMYGTVRGTQWGYSLWEFQVYGTPTSSSGTPTPPPSGGGSTTPASGSPVPNGPSGNWALKFDDEFNGTSLDTSKWNPMNNGHMNNVTTMGSNVSVGNGVATLTLSDSSHGAEICTCTGSSGEFALPVGGVAEASVYFPGDSSHGVYNWPAWWSSGPNWPSAGENDIAEGLSGDLTVNYHGTSNSQNYGAPSGTWYGGFHTYTLYRHASSADVYWDGQLVRSYSTGDNGAGESLIVNVGASGSAVTGAASAVKVDYVRAWTPA
jgi:hypothetical protein